MSQRRRLVFRVYGFAALVSLAIIVVLLVLPRYTRGARYLEPQAALVQYLVERLSTKDAAGFEEVFRRIDQRVRGKLSLYDTHGKLLRSNVTPALENANASELADLETSKWSLSYGRIVVKSDDGALIGIYHPNQLGFPWGYVLPLGAAILLVVFAASLWLTRRVTTPLDQLAAAARKFGEGDTTARAKIQSRLDEIKDVGRAFDEMADRTSAMIQAQRQLMADVSHELRTPLARIRVALELVVEDPVAAKDVLADVGGDLDEIDQLINDILTTARLDGDAATVERHATRVGDLTDRAVQKFAARHPNRKLESSITGTDKEIACDPVLLRRAVDNLLDNAAKYSDSGTPVTFAVKPDGETVAFEIIDKGIGMSAEELTRAFTPFWRADGSRARKTGGVGLGLALARRIARVHGGDVTLISQPGKGTTARLDVPLALES
ncbi:MAG TPA: HAMP domain-containing sensor histidine kinase [Kofleriaceae bacterium]|jgi:signal transduction histidine kinase